MSWSYDTTVSSDRDRIRLLINDTDDSDPDNHYFEDEELDAFLAMEGGIMKLGAAAALETLASSEVMIQKRIRLLDLSTDGPAESKELRDRASDLRDQYFEGDSQLPMTAELVLDPHSFEERMNNERRRRG